MRLKSESLYWLIGLVAVAAAIALSLRFGQRAAVATVRPTLEDRMPDGSLFTPSTQSFLRERHWLETVDALRIEVDADLTARVEFVSPENDHRLSLANYPLHCLVPRLHYPAAAEPDAFDALNLMLAEYSRNSISAPVGKAGDAMAHFRTTLPETTPWALAGDYQFKPKKHVRPIRVGLVNNCLKPGLWEISASDRSGEIYHAWFDMPEDLYYDLVAQVNGVPADFAEQALVWKSGAAPLDLDRLRTVTELIGELPFSLHREAGARGFSTQDSRRKLARGFALVAGEEGYRPPRDLAELTRDACRLTEFVEPGKYALGQYREFDLRFLAAAESAEFRRVAPRTDYAWRERERREDRFDYLEMVLRLGDGYALIIGALPLQLLSPREDFAIHGFGVGVLSSSEPAERRKYLLEDGPAPSFAYLARETEQGWTAVNSHEFGLEQIFIRTHLRDGSPWWEVTVTSYERIVDLVKYRVPIPEPLWEDVERHALEYITPMYYTYRDDNLR